MAYSDFTSPKQLLKKFGISNEKIDFVEYRAIAPIKASDRCLADIAESLMIPNSTEKSKSELLIMPILREAWRQSDWRFSIFSGFTFDVQAEDGLNGVCDYILTTDTRATDITAPVFCVVEAKNRGIEEGIAQAGAEMYAAQLFNEQEGTPTPIVYGCVTNAFDWLFLRLENKVLYIDTKRYYVNETELPKLLGILHYTVGLSLK